MTQSQSGASAEITRGWLPLLAATLGCGAGASSLVFYSLGVFVAPLEAAFGWTRGQVTSAMLYSSAGLILAGPLLGWLIDRFGERRIALISIPGFALVLWSLSAMNGQLPLFYACFFMAAVLGCGTTPILHTRAIAARFDKARGLALGITLAGPGTAALFLPPFLTAQIAAHDWRHGFVLLTLMALSPWLIVALGFSSGPRHAGAAPENPNDHGRREALRSRTFWTLAVCFIVVAAGASALVVHMVPMLRDAGLDAAAAARVASVIGIGIILGRLLIGWLIDRVFAPRVAAVIFAIAAGGCLMLAYGGAEQARPAAFMIGFALGAEVDLMAYLISRYFGLRHYGFLYGSIYAGFWVGVAGGPAIAGRLFDQLGNYALTLLILCGLFVVGAVCALSLPRFTPRQQAS